MIFFTVSFSRFAPTPRPNAEGRLTLRGGYKGIPIVNLGAILRVGDGKLPPHCTILAEIITKEVP